MRQKREFLLTSEGFLELETELNRLKSEDRPRIIEAIKEARAQGDLSENADYDAAREEQAKIEARIQELEYMLEHAKIIEKVSGDVVQVGTTVTVKYVDDDEEEEYSIVGSMEADPFENKISNESPIGKALLGRKKNDIVDVETPGGMIQFKILKITK